MAFPRFNPPPSRRGPIREWDTKRCRKCGRDRVHYRTEVQGWRCIGTLPGRTARRCGKPRAGAHLREVA